ncbi:hypothetical protein DFQ30_006624 [Apophysomyces sp. BC1015]|nr:hypothetical protein DFQ30_006624 [Apophysomyces sp. BC1015]
MCLDRTRPHKCLQKENEVLPDGNSSWSSLDESPQQTVKYNYASSGGQIEPQISDDGKWKIEGCDVTAHLMQYKRLRTDAERQFHPEQNLKAPCQSSGSSLQCQLKSWLVVF